MGDTGARKMKVLGEVKNWIEEWLGVKGWGRKRLGEGLDWRKD